MTRNVWLLVVAAVVLLWLAWPRALGILIGDLQATGQFGDSFGGLNTLFAGLAFAGVIYTIFLQQKELSLQREELKLTRAELARSAKAQERSQRALGRQVEVMNITAELSARSALLEHFQDRLNAIPHGKGYDDSRRDRAAKPRDRALTALMAALENLEMFTTRGEAEDDS